MRQGGTGMGSKTRHGGCGREFVTSLLAIVCCACLALPAQAQVMDISLQTRPFQGVVIAAAPSGPRLLVEFYSAARLELIVRGVATSGFSSRDRLVILGVPDPVVTRWSRQPFVRSAQVYFAPMCFDHAQGRRWQPPGGSLQQGGVGRAREPGEGAAKALVRILGGSSLAMAGIGDISLSALHGEGHERVGYAMLRIQMASISAGVLYPAYHLRDDAPIREDELLVFSPIVLPAFAHPRLLRQLDPDVAIVLSRRQDLQKNEKWETALETLRELWIDVYTVEGRALVISVGPHGMLLPSMRSVR